MSFNKKILSVDSDDDGNNYEAFSEYLDHNTQRKKSKTAKEIQELGDELIDEIERKKRNKEQKSRNLIPYILKKCDGKYSEKELISYSYNDVKDIYDEIKFENRPIIVKFFHFIFNL